MLKHLALARDYLPVQSPYASQVVAVHKKSGEIHLCVHYAFPLPHIGEALQASA